MRWKWSVRCMGRERMYCLLLTVAAMGSTAMAMADPDGTAGLTQANTMIRSYFQYGADILYAVGALVGLVGSLRVYNKWSHGEPDTTKAASNWFGACIFLVIVATVLKSFFGLT